MLGGSQENDSRQYPRTPIRLKVCLQMSERGEIFAVTRDISDGGLFILIDAEQMPPIGQEVRVQVQGLPNGMEAPWVKMRVVRTDSDGIGLMILT